jgi:tyrosinase
LDQGCQQLGQVFHILSQSNLPIDTQRYNFGRSPVFDPKTGFGGNGVGHTSCVRDGPFSSYQLSLGPGNIVNDHCLQRVFNSSMLPFITSGQVANTTKQPTFELFRVELEGTPVTPTVKVHDGGHFSVAGEMANRYSSPGGTSMLCSFSVRIHFLTCGLDPLFYLHHANLDRLWWIWQMLDAPKRLFEISGRSTVDPPFVNVTLDFQLDMGALAPPVPIRDVMDIGGDTLCIDYV